MALSAAASALRGVVLRHLRIPVTGVAQQSVSVPSMDTIVRFMGGGFLPKDEVTQRVLHVTKHFEKIDQSKVCMPAPLCSFCTRRMHKYH